MPEQLLFVNKTPSSTLLTRSKQAEKAKILSHVQSNRRKQEARQAGQKPTAVVQPRTSETAASGIRKIISPTETLIHFGSGDNDNIQVAAEDDVRKMKMKQKSIPSYHQYMYPTHNSSDPFHCTVASTDAGNHILLHCTLTSVWRTMFLAEAFAPPEVISLSLSLAASSRSQSQSQSQLTDRRHALVFGERLRRCVEDPALMYATLAYGSTYLAWNTGQTLPDLGLSAEYFLGKALREVRMRLASTGMSQYQYQYQYQHQDQEAPRKEEGKRRVRQEVDPWLILAIYYLSVTEQWNGMPELWRRFPNKYAVVVKTGKFGRLASRVHTRALLRLVGIAGGWGVVAGLSSSSSSSRIDDTGGVSEVDGLDSTCRGRGRGTDMDLEAGMGIGGYLLDSAILADKYLSMYEFAAPFVPLDWGPGSMPPPQRSIKELEAEEDPFPRLGTGFQAVDSISTVVKATFVDIADYCRIAHRAWTAYRPRYPGTDGGSGDGDGIDSAMEMWLFRRLQELTCRLMTMSHNTEQDQTNDTHTDTDTDTDTSSSPLHVSPALSSSSPLSKGSSPPTTTISRVEQCLCLAAQIFLLGCTGNIGAQTAAIYQALRLRVLLMDHMDDLKPPKKDRRRKGCMDKRLLLWCLSTGAFLPGKFPSRDWFVDRMKEVWLKLEVHVDVDLDGQPQPRTGTVITEEALRGALNPYLFLGDRQREGMEYLVSRE